MDGVATDGRDVGLPERTSFWISHRGRLTERKDRPRTRHPLRLTAIVLASMGFAALPRRCRVGE